MLITLSCYKGIIQVSVVSFFVSIAIMAFSMKISKMLLERVQKMITWSHQSQMEYLFPRATQGSLWLFLQFSLYNFCLQIRLILVKMQNYKARGSNSALKVNKMIPPFSSYTVSELGKKNRSLQVCLCTFLLLLGAVCKELMYLSQCSNFVRRTGFKHFCFILELRLNIHDDISVFSTFK